MKEGHKKTGRREVTSYGLYRTTDNLQLRFSISQRRSSQVPPLKISQRGPSLWLVWSCQREGAFVLYTPLTNYTSIIISYNLTANPLSHLLIDRLI